MLRDLLFVLRRSHGNEPKPDLRETAHRQPSPFEAVPPIAEKDLERTQD